MITHANQKHKFGDEVRVTAVESNMEMMAPDAQIPSKPVEIQQKQYERVLHKMITNTLQHYEISGSYSPDDVLKILKQQKLLEPYAEAATHKGDLNDLNAIIDLGSKPL